MERLQHDLITRKQYVEFMVGRDGEFDLLVASAIRRAVKQYGYGNTSLILVLPYMKAEYRDNEQNYLSYYDEAEHIGRCSMLKSKENKSEIWLTANFDSGGRKVDNRTLESIFIL